MVTCAAVRLIETINTPCALHDGTSHFTLLATLGVNSILDILNLSLPSDISHILVVTDSTESLEPRSTRRPRSKELAWQENGLA